MGLFPSEDSTPLKSIMKKVRETHSPSPANAERDREHKIRYTALAGNATLEETRAVSANG